MGLNHLGCPSCGGTLTVAEGQRTIRCAYCGGEHLVLVPGAVPRYAVSPEIDREGARAAAEQVLRRPVLPRALRRRGRIQEVALCYAPFYEFTGTRVGTFRLQVAERRPTRDPAADEPDPAQRLQEVPAERTDTRVIQQGYLRVEPACSLPELGTARIPLAELRRGRRPVGLEPFDLVELQRRAVVFAPTQPMTGFVEDSQRHIQAAGDKTRMVEGQAKVLYYPVWQARYRYQGRPYEIAVDGVSGAVLAARVPRSIGLATALAVGILAVGALCVGRPAQAFARRMAILGGTSGRLFGWVGCLGWVLLGGAVVCVVAWTAWKVAGRGGDLFLDEGPAPPPSDVTPGGREPGQS